MSDTHFRGRVAQKAVLVKDGKVLVTRDSRDKVFELPGGRLDDSEEPAAGILREIKEELGVEAKILDVLSIETMYHQRDQESMLVIYYEIGLVNEGANFDVDPKEVDEMQWVDKDTYKSFEYFPEYRIVLDSYFNKT